MSKLFHRKLSALKHPQPQKFNLEDDLQFKNIILWVEDQKIRHYKIEDRKDLRSFQEPGWTKSYEKYLKDLECPYSGQDRKVALDWVLGLAVRLEYGDDVEKFAKITAKSISQQRDKASSPNLQMTIQNIDVKNPEFRKGVEAIAKLLGIQLHEDYLVTLKAIRIFVEQKLKSEAIEKAQTEKKSKGSKIPVKDNELGFNTKDEILDNAARALRLLHINELRELQTKINQAIVSVQTITANPKTDQRLGKVGR